MNRDKIEGGMRNLRGRGKTALGAVAGRPRQQAEGAFDQAAGAVQYAYGEARDTARGLRRDGEHFAGEAVERGRAFADNAQERGRAFADEAQERGRHYGRQAARHGRAVAHAAEGNKSATLLLIAAAAFGIGWLSGRSR